MFVLTNFRRFINSFKQVIGIADPDLQHGRIGREETIKRTLRAAKLMKPRDDKDSKRGSPEIVGSDPSWNNRDFL